MSTVLGSEPPAEGEPVAAAPAAGGPLALCKTIAMAALLAPVAVLGRLGVVRADQWTDIRKQVVSSVLAAFVVGGPTAIYTSWDKLFPERLPPAFEGKRIGILVAKLDGDSSGTHQTHVLRTLQRMFTAGSDTQAELRAYPRALVVDRAQEVFAGEQAATQRGREWLAKQNADFLVWGEIAGTNVLRLRILARAAQTNLSPLQMTPYRLDSESFLLPATFSEDFGRLLNAFANALAGPSLANNGDPRLLEVLQPVEARLRTLFEHPPQAIKPADHTEIGLALASVSDAIALRSGVPARFQNSVRFYERLERLAASSGDTGIMGRYAFNFGVLLFSEGGTREDVPIIRRSLTMMDKALAQWTRDKHPNEWMRAKLYFCVGSQMVAMAEKDAATFDRLFEECIPFFREAAVTKALFPNVETVLAVSRLETLLCKIEMRRAEYFASTDLFDRALADCRASEQRIAQHLQGTRPIFYLTSMAEEIFGLYPLHRNDALIVQTAAELKELHKKISPDVMAELIEYARDVSCIARLMEASLQNVPLPVEAVKEACDATFKRPIIRGYSKTLEVGRGIVLAAASDNLALDWPRVRDIKRMELLREYLTQTQAAYADRVNLSTVRKAMDCILALVTTRISGADAEAARLVDGCTEAVTRLPTEYAPSGSGDIYAPYARYFRAYAARLSGDRDALVKAKAEYEEVFAQMKARWTSVHSRYFGVIAADIDTMLAELDGKPTKLH